jgi:outer membrane protein assembly factor BamA
VLEEYLASLKRPEKVAGALGPTDSGQMVVTFRPAVAPPPVAFVKFTNNKVLPTTVLQNKMIVVAVGQPYREARFRQMLQANVVPLYEARGRLRVTFPEIKTEKAPDVKGLVVTVKVDEGESYTLGVVNIDGPGIPPEESKKAANIQTGDLANFDQVQAAVGRVEALYRREGYIKVSSRMDRKIDDRHKTVDVTIHMLPGPQYLFGKLTIEGLDLNAEAAIRKLWAMQEGKRFNADYPDYFLEEVRQGGYFDNLGKTKAVVNPDDASHTVNVKLVFSGAPPAPPDRFHRRPGQGLPAVG